MTNPRLTPEQLDHARTLLEQIRARLAILRNGDAELLFAYRRKVAKELTYDVRGKPMGRRRLKKIKMKEQREVCPLCSEPLPTSGAVLDRTRGL